MGQVLPNVLQNFVLHPDSAACRHHAANASLESALQADGAGGAGGSAGGGEEDGWTLSLLGACGEWPLTNPHERGQVELAHVARLAREGGAAALRLAQRGAAGMAAVALADAAAVSGAAATAPQTARGGARRWTALTTALARFARWLERCLSTSPPLCALLRGGDGASGERLVGALETALRSSSGLASLDEMASRSDAAWREQAAEQQAAEDLVQRCRQALSGAAG